LPKTGPSCTNSLALSFDFCIMFGSTLAFGGYGQSQADVPMTQGSPQKEQAGGDSNTLIPVTIHMLEKAASSQVSGGDFRVDGRPTNMMLVVGAVEELTRQQASMEFALNDSTGRMKARFFFPSDLNLDSVQNGTYVSAVGVLKTQPAVHFSLVALHPVQSPDQISYHMIEVAHASLRSKGKLAGKQATTTKAADFSSSPNQAVAATPRPLVPTSSQAPTATPSSAPSVPAAVESGPLRERIAAFLSTTSNAEGVAFAELTTHFNTATSEAVRAAVTELLDDGSAYTTIDDDHFASV